MGSGNLAEHCTLALKIPEYYEYNLGAECLPGILTCIKVYEHMLS